MRQSLTLNLFAFFVAFLAFISSVAAQVPTTTDVQTALINSLTISSGIGAAIYIIFGILFVFWGYKLFRFVLFIIGFYIGSALAYIVLVNLQPSSGWNNADWIFFGVCLAVGILFGFLFICFYKLGILGIGGFGGFTLAVWILSFKAGGVIDSQTGRIIFILVLIVAGMIAAWFFEKPAIIIGTSVVGAVSVFLGIDVFARTGVTEIIISFVASPGTVKAIGATITPGQYGILVAMAVLAIIGIVLQFRWNKNIEHHRSAPLYKRMRKNTSNA